MNKQTNNVEPMKLTNPGLILTKKDIKPKQIYHKTQLDQEKILRDQLFGTKSNFNIFSYIGI
jgi:hypothetical protein